MEPLTDAMSKLNTKGLPEGFRIDITKSQPVANKMFIGGLAYNTSKKALVEYLAQFGEIIDFTLKTNPVTGQLKGFGFVLFKDAAAVEKVLRFGEHTVCGRKIELRRAKVKEAKPFWYRKVFVGGLSPHVSEESIRDHFGKFGAIEKMEFPVCPSTNERRAFCFVTFADETAAKRVVEARYHYFGSGHCEVKIAHRNEYPRPPYRGPRQAPLAGPGPGPRNPWGDSRGLPNPNACRGNENVWGPIGGADPDVSGAAGGADLNAVGAAGGADPNVSGAAGGADPSASGAAAGADPYASGAAGGADPNALGAVGGVEGASTVLVPVPFPAYNQAFTFADQKYGDFYGGASTQAEFNSYGGQYFVGCNYGAPLMAPAYNAPTTDAAAAPFASGCQGVYHLF